MGCGELGYICVEYRGASVEETEGVGVGLGWKMVLGIWGRSKGVYTQDKYLVGFGNGNVKYFDPTAFYSSKPSPSRRLEHVLP